MTLIRFTANNPSLVVWAYYYKKSVFVCTTPRNWHMLITFNLSFSGNVFLFRPVCQWKLVLWWTLGGEGELLLVFFPLRFTEQLERLSSSRLRCLLHPKAAIADLLTAVITSRSDHIIPTEETIQKPKISRRKKKMKCKHSRAFCLSRQYYICILRQEKNLSSLVTFITFL